MSQLNKRPAWSPLFFKKTQKKLYARRISWQTFFHRDCTAVSDNKTRTGYTTATAATATTTATTTTTKQSKTPPGHGNARLSRHKTLSSAIVVAAFASDSDRQQ